MSTLDLVRSQTIGTLELIGVPGASDTSASIGSTWQSVDTQYTSSPLVIVKTCALVPAFSTHVFLPVFVIVTESCGCSPASYTVLSVTASTTTFFSAHASPSAATGSVGITVGGGSAASVAAGVADEVRRDGGIRLIALAGTRAAR